MGRYERLFIIDGDHIHLVAVDQKMLDMSSKTTTLNIKDVISCKQSKKSSHFRIVVVKAGGDLRSYDMEAGSAGEVVDIVARVTLMQNK
jgi:hypothetical protein